MSDTLFILERARALAGCGAMKDTGSLVIADATCIQAAPKPTFSEASPCRSRGLGL